MISTYVTNKYNEINWRKNHKNIVIFTTKYRVCTYQGVRDTIGKQLIKIKVFGVQS